MTRSKSVIVVGGGVIGLCSAWFALQKGHSVTLLERGARDHDCCSLGNAGIIVPSHIVPLAAPGMVGMGLRMMFQPDGPFTIRPRLSRDLLRWGWIFCRSANERHVAQSTPLLRDLHLASRLCYEEFAQMSGNEFALVKKGMLMLCKSEKALHEEAKLAELARNLGLSAEVLTPQETAERDPNIRMEIAGSVYFAQDCHLTPPRFMAWLTSALEQAGARFSWSTGLTGWRTGSGRIEAVQTDQGEFSADEYVLACGSWSAELLRGLSLRLPLQAGKGYNITVPTPPRLPSLCSILNEARVAVTPMGSSLRFAGTMEITGLDASIDQARVNGMRKAVADYFPEFRSEDLQGHPVWSGLRPCSPDGLPYIGRSGRYANLCIATGHAMMGLSLGPVTGKLVSEILSDEPPSIPIGQLSPDRYA